MRNQMRRSAVILVFAMATAVTARAQSSPYPSLGAYCMNAGKWIPINMQLGTPLSYTPPAVGLYGANNSAWYPAACDANGNLQTSMGNYATAPATCSPGQTYYNTAGTSPYWCGPANTWNAFGGSGTFNQLTGDATSGANGGATTVKGINNTLLSSLATGPLYNTTTTGVPSIETAPQAISALGSTPAINASAMTNFPTFNQSTTGSAASLSISGQSALLLFTGLASTNRTKTVRDAADTLLELGGSYTPTGTWTWTSATATWPTFNQNTSGTAANLSGTPALPNGTTATTQTLGDNTTKIATDAFVLANVGSGMTYPSSTYYGLSGGSSWSTSHLSDNGTTITASENFTAPALVSGTPSSGALAAIPSGAHGMACDESSTAGVPASSVDYIRCGTGGMVGSDNNGAESAVVLAAASQTLTNKSIAGSEINSGTVASTYIGPPTTVVSSGSVAAVTTNNTYIICTSTCNVTPLQAAAGVQLCVRNAPGSATVITLNALGSSNYYELTTHAAWGTANHTVVSGGAQTDAICLVGYDATHYAVMSYNGTWTD